MYGRIHKYIFMFVDAYESFSLSKIGVNQQLNCICHQASCLFCAPLHCFFFSVHVCVCEPIVAACCLSVRVCSSVCVLVLVASCLLLRAKKCKSERKTSKIYTNVIITISKKNAEHIPYACTIRKQL